MADREEVDGMALIERDEAAKALYACSPPEFDFPWDRATDEDRAPYYEAADAVLSAINHRGAVSRVGELERLIREHVDALAPRDGSTFAGSVPFEAESLYRAAFGGQYKTDPHETADDAGGHDATENT